MTKYLLALTLFFLACIHPTPGNAKDRMGFLSFSLGMYNTLDRPKMLNTRLEYRPESIVFFKKLKPWAGLELNSELSLWAGAGMLADFDLGRHFILTPSFGAGYYARGRSRHDLSFPLEFRSQLELAYQFKNRSRLALAFSHTSNASLGRPNPGEEVLSLYYHVPFGLLF